MNDAKFYDDIIRNHIFQNISGTIQFSYARNFLGNFTGNILRNRDKEMQKLDQISPTRISPVISSARRVIPNNDSFVDEPFSILKKLRTNNVNRIIVGHLNINSLRYKFEELKDIVKSNVDIIILSETKIDDRFPTNQFLINGFSVPFRADGNKNGGGILVYIRDNIPAKLLQINTEIESICFHISLRNRKWFICAAYNPQKNLSSSFFKVLTTCVESYLKKRKKIYRTLCKIWL